MANKDMKVHPTPMLDELEKGPWPSFITGLKRLRDADKRYSPVVNDLLGQLEHSYEEKLGFWKGGAISVLGYGAGVIPRFSEVADKFPESSEFHLLRIIPPAGFHYNTDLLRKFCDVWEKYGAGFIVFHGQSGDIMFQGVNSENTQAAFDELNEMGFDMGGAGPDLRTSMNCVGHARCEMSCYDEIKLHRSILNEYLDEMHRPALPYKFKFKFSGCPNDCVNAIHRADMAIIGTWRDDMKVDQAKVKEYVEELGRDYIQEHVVGMCPSKSLKLNDDDTLEVDNKSCVRCMHCLNVMTKALSPGDDKGVVVLIGGKRTLKIGDLMGTVIRPFVKLDTDEQIEEFVEWCGEVIDFFAENALEHERTGEMIDRIGLPAFLEGVGVEPDPNMVLHPRQVSYVRTDDFQEELEKARAKKAAKEAAE